MYSPKARTGFLVVLVILLGTFAFVSSDTDLFKGQLTVSEPSQLSLDVPKTVDPAGCSGASRIIDDQPVSTAPSCRTATFKVTPAFDATNTDVFIKYPDTNEVVASYKVDLFTGQTTEIGFDGVNCGEYAFNSEDYSYTKVATTECQPGEYEFIVSGNNGETLFTSAKKFTLAKSN